MLDNELKDFFKQYKSDDYVHKFMNNLKEKQLSKSSNISESDIVNSFMVTFPIDLLNHYHSWLITHYSLIPKD